MIEIKPHFIKLEETRLTYSIPFSNLDNHIVYGKLKDVEGDYIVNQAYTEVIPKSDYSYSDGKIIFSNKPCTLYPYDSIKIVELQDGVPSGKRGITTLRIFLTIYDPFIFNA